MDPRNTLEPVDQDVPLCWTEPPRSLIMYPRDDDPECIYVVDSHKHIREISLNWLSDITSKQQENVCSSFKKSLTESTPTPTPKQVRDTSVRNVSSSTCTAVVWSRYVGSLLQYSNSVLSRVTIAPRFNRYVVDKIVQNSTTMTTTTSRDDTKPIRDLLSEVQRFTQRTCRGGRKSGGDLEKTVSLLSSLLRVSRVTSKTRCDGRKRTCGCGRRKRLDASRTTSSRGQESSGQYTQTYRELQNTKQRDGETSDSSPKRSERSIETCETNVKFWTH